MRTGHLFAGAGGGLYADLILGHRPQFAVEWDGYAAAALKERADEGWFPDLHVYHGDVRMFDASAWKGRVDSLHAGFPCQDISVAGNGAGIKGERSGLWSEVVRVADETEVPELWLENSPAITSRGLGTVLGDLAELGFDAEWCVLPASAVGAPHRRARWWCIARRTNAVCMGRDPQRKQGHYKPLQDDDGKHQAEEQGRDEFELRAIGHGANVADAVRQRLQRIIPEFADEKIGPQQSKRPDRSRGNGIGWWTSEPAVGRVVDGLANRGHRIKALGNGQVPLQAAAAYVLLDARLGT